MMNDDSFNHAYFKAGAFHKLARGNQRIIAGMVVLMIVLVMIAINAGAANLTNQQIHL